MAWAQKGVCGSALEFFSDEAASCLRTPVPARPEWISALSVPTVNRDCMALLYGVAWCLTSQNGGFRPGQNIPFSEKVTISVWVRIHTIGRAPLLRFRRPGTVLGAQEIFTAVNPYMLGVPIKSRGGTQLVNLDLCKIVPGPR